MAKKNKKEEKKEITEHWVSYELTKHFLYNWLMAIAIHGNCVYFQNHILFKAVTMTTGTFSFLLFIYFCWFKIRLFLKKTEASMGIFLVLGVLFSVAVMNYNFTEDEKKKISVYFKKKKEQKEPVKRKKEILGVIGKELYLHFSHNTCIRKKLKELANRFPAMVILGPRSICKNIFVRNAFFGVGFNKYVRFRDV